MIKRGIYRQVGEGAMVAQIDKSMIRMRPAKALMRLVAWSLLEGRPLTTKGRWINPLVFFLYRSTQYFPLHAGSRKPIFILGTGRSGTTILGKLFAMHKDAVFLNEPKAAWHFVHGEEDIAGSYSMSPARVRINADEFSEHASRRLQHIYSFAIRLGMSKRVVDKYPELIYRLPYVTSLFPEGKSVAILRDGVDTCASIAAWSQREGNADAGHTHDWWGRDNRKWKLLVEQLVPENSDLARFSDRLANNSNHVDRAAVEWILATREVKRAQARYPERLLSIAYEDLCADPEKVLKLILSYCDLSPDDGLYEYAKGVMSPSRQDLQLALDPDLLPIFRQTLASAGYGDSISRTSARV
ncbi:sulfotransferase family protein [Qipengyuania mesophila]|uniref:sulfotransferase family protein n=1 Tax=Qipengyuania mesophila TaxID=2867246 RepID=UPI00351678AB